MGQVTVSINDRSYDITCDDGQEAHLAQLAAYIDRRVGELIQAVGQVGEARLLVMASLLVADELSDAFSEIEALRAAGGGDVEAWRQAEDAIADSLHALAGRIEAVADRLDPA